MSCWCLAAFRFDHLSVFVGTFVGLFTVLTLGYSSEFMRKNPTPHYPLSTIHSPPPSVPLFRYYACVILTCAASLGAVFSNNLVLFMVFWGFLGLLLYLLIGFGENARSSYTAKKAFIIIGGTDAFMLLGLALLWHLAGRPALTSLKMSAVSVALDSKTAMAAYLCLAAGALAKAGAMPFHTWVPDTAEDAPTPVAAFLPASLDKLLGIYFFFRLTVGMFQVTPGMNTFLMLLGSFTIVAAVMMALVQHDLKRLLGYHAVSQVGYMVLGIGTGNPIGIAGGLFHMLNNTIYKSCLFLAGGAVEKRAGTTDLDKLGGFAKAMPISFVTFLVASLAISGVPPFNGFVSKWMVYQGVIETGRAGGANWVLWLVAAMFGSALTLASFMKLLHAVFLGQPSAEARAQVEGTREVGPAMWLPMVILAGLCVVFGVFAFNLPLKLFILPSIETGIIYAGAWRSVVATALILIGLAIGVIIYLVGAAEKARIVEPFVGGETLSDHTDVPWRDMRMSGVDFYRTIQQVDFLRVVYPLAEKKVFDVYDVGMKVTFGINKALGYIHNGVLPRYLGWCLLGAVIILYVLSR